MNKVFRELREHSPFTMFGALTGILMVMMLRNISHSAAHALFYVFHPAHVVLSALVTTALYRRYLDHEQPGWRRFLKVFAVGFSGSLLIGTLSDSLIPFWGETLLNMPHRHAHIGFVDKWWLVNPLAAGAVLFAYYRPFTKFPHAGHVLISTWASLFHVLMAAEQGAPFQYFGIFVFLFLAVWLPCCFSDIVFPLLFVRERRRQR
ncbi:MAG: hypothetical protein GF333_03475 [Candidatus Omnitrophica bacterium]|nr:hypothetical protein [Candidatus Omnitrophota bacterium]